MQRDPKRATILINIDELAHALRLPEGARVHVGATIVPPGEYPEAEAKALRIDVMRRGSQLVCYEPERPALTGEQLEQIERLERGEAPAEQEPPRPAPVQPRAQRTAAPEKPAPEKPAPEKPAAADAKPAG